MESLQIRTGEIQLQVLNDLGEPRGIFKFNPEDVKAAKNFFQVSREFNEQYAEFENKAKSCVTPEEKATLLTELVDYFEKLIDDCFGEGSSAVLFGEAKTLSMFFDFFEGITPYYQKASENRMSKYAPKSSRKKSK